MPFIKSKEGRVLLELRIIPLSKDQMIEVQDEELPLLIHLRSPPHKNKANKELLKYLSSILDVKLGDIRIIKGTHSKNKIIEILGKNVVKIKKKLYKICTLTNF